VGALTIPVLAQYFLLRLRLEVVDLQPDVEDQVQWRWCSSKTYSASLAYWAVFLGSSELLGSRQLLHVRALGEHKFFSCLVLQDPHWMAELQQQHGLQ
jgi:hypothetical protein